MTLWRGLNAQMDRMAAGDPSPEPVPADLHARMELWRRLWREVFAAHTGVPSWSSFMVDAAVRWAAPTGTAELWLGLFDAYGQVVEPNVLHWNLAGFYWNASRAAPPDLVFGEPVQRLTPAQAMLIGRFVHPLPWEALMRAALADCDLPEREYIDGGWYRADPGFDTLRAELGLVAP